MKLCKEKRKEEFNAALKIHGSRRGPRPGSVRTPQPHVCRGCWSALGDAHAACPQCSVRVLHAGETGSFPPGQPLRSRFCVRI